MTAHISVYTDYRLLEVGQYHIPKPTIDEGQKWRLVEGLLPCLRSMVARTDA
jgi:hypothetical protein